MSKIGYIYKIFDNTNGNIYYGSTKQKLSRRLAHHREDYKKYLEGKKHYYTSFKIIENNDYCISLVEQFEFNNKEELIAKERYYIENNECVNKIIPGRTRKEYRLDNKEKIKEINKLYYKDNKERIAEQTKQYRNDNKEVVAERKKKFYENNKEVIAEKYKKWRENNKEKILEKKKQKIDCPICGCNILKDGLARHKRTKKCLSFVR